VAVVVQKLSEALVAASLPVRLAFRHADKDSYVTPIYLHVYVYINYIIC
jgi:hypothetical protein